MKTLVTQTRSFAATIAVFAAIAHPTVHADITAWAPVVDPAKGVLNVDPAKSASAGSLAVLPTPSGPRLYAAWSESGDSNRRQVRVAVYNGNDLAPTWAQVDSRVNGIPRTPSQGITFNPTFGHGPYKPMLAVCNGILYAAWTEYSRNLEPFALRVARYNGNDGAPNWTFIDGNTAAGLNCSPKKSADTPALVAFQGRLFAFWREQSEGKKLAIQLRARAYSDVSGSWTWLDGGGVAGLNINPARSVTGIRLAPVVHESLDKLYIGFGEFDANNIIQIRAKVYQGGQTWALADGGATLKLNPAVQPSASTVLSAGAFPGGICLSWSEPNAAGKYQIRMASYDGASDASPSWIRLDGGDPAVGLNYNPGFSGYGYPEIIALNGKTYRGWKEASATNGWDQLRVRSWDGVQWTWADGGGPLSTVNPFAGGSDGVSSMAAFNSKLYLLSVERPLSGTDAYRGFVSVGLETP